MSTRLLFCCMCVPLVIRGIRTKPRLLSWNLQSATAWGVGQILTQWWQGYFKCLRLWMYWDNRVWPILPRQWIQLNLLDGIPGLLVHAISTTNVYHLHTGLLGISSEEWRLCIQGANYINFFFFLMLCFNFRGTAYFSRLHGRPQEVSHGPSLAPHHH